MSKPTLLLNPGVGWAATTPFHYTLTLDNKYAHMGHKKENWYLKRLYHYPKYEEQFQEIYSDNFSSKYNIDVNKRPSHHPWGQTLSKRNKYVANTSLDPYFASPPSIDNYISYWKGHWENIKGTYAAVCDFTNGNYALPYEFWVEVAPKLREHFNVKVTFQFRDPVRRYFSEVGSLLTKKFEFSVENCQFYTDRKTRLLIRRKKHKQLFFHLLKQGCMSDLCDFCGAYTIFTRVFGVENTYVTIMEDLWDKNQEKEQLEALSNFLSYKITKLHENCYVPDMGSRAPHLPFLQDQWESDIDDLTVDDYNVALLYMTRYYTDFKNTFGYLPSSWKK